MNIPDITHAELLERLSYDPLTGVFVYKVAPGNGPKVGMVVGGRTINGYRVTRIGGKHVSLHRLAWFYIYGEWPSQFIDHVNHDGLDNRIANLRQADHLLNGQNRASASRNSTTGILGVYLSRGKWAAKITFNGKQKHIGTYSCAADASRAYQAAKLVYHAAVYRT